MSRLLQKNAFVALSLLSSLVIPAYSEEFQTVGIETINSEKLDEIKIQKNVYIGQCPGMDYEKVEGYFVNYDHMPAKDLRLKITNFGKGLSPSNPPFTERAYDSGRASEIIKMGIGSKHARNYFALREGLNPLKYKIYNNVTKIPVKQGTVMVKVFVNETTYRRDKRWVDYLGKYSC